jgi:hypothetical protein
MTVGVPTLSARAARVIARNEAIQINKDEKYKPKYGHTKSDQQLR